MATKLDRKSELPPGLIPLLSQAQLETYYDVSDWKVLQWIKEGMPVEQTALKAKRFDLAKVQAWHAEQAELAKTA